MINILDKKDCCGCSACAQICPKQCIKMSADNEGFSYPAVDGTICIKCGLCEKVCPVINLGTSKLPLATYAAKNTNEDIRLNSSSGGIFTLLAEQIIADGGVVFGVKFDLDWNVVHDFTETIDGLEAFRGSKYVQSSIGDNFKIAKQFLSNGRKVLFSGTPCQIAGLKKYLQKEYDNLLTIEVVCHGVPSPKIWKEYLNFKYTKHIKCFYKDSTSSMETPQISGISFRDKSNGWKKYGVKFSFTDKHEITPFNEDLYMKGFLQNLYLRPSCYQCAARQGKSGADISIADYWGIQSIHPEFDDDKGAGLILINSNKGVRYYENIKSSTITIASKYHEAIKYNPCINHSVRVPKERAIFFQQYNIHGIKYIGILSQKTPTDNLKKIIKRILRKVKSLLRL